MCCDVNLLVNVKVHVNVNVHVHVHVHVHVEVNVNVHVDVTLSPVAPGVLWALGAPQGSMANPAKSFGRAPVDPRGLSRHCWGTPPKWLRVPGSRSAALFKLSARLNFKERLGAAQPFCAPSPEAHPQPPRGQSRKPPKPSELPPHRAHEGRGPIAIMSWLLEVYVYALDAKGLTLPAQSLGKKVNGFRKGRQAGDVIWIARTCRRRRTSE